MGGEIGSLAPGRRGDVVIWSGDPLEISAPPRRCSSTACSSRWTTRQTKLRDRYRTLERGALPEAYRR